MTKESSRRRFLKNGVKGLGVLSLPDLLQADHYKDQKFNIACIGGHPDDPESGCGGTLARFAGAGHAVTIIYLTRGEAGIPGKSHSEAAYIRTRESEAACNILNTKPVFAGQTDGDTVLNNDWVQRLQVLLDIEKPDIVLPTGQLIPIKITR